MIAALLALAAPAEIPIRSFDVVSRAIPGGRLPIPRDAVTEAIVSGTFPPPRDERWRKLETRADGWLESNDLVGAYAYASMELPEAKTMILEAIGHSFAYVNGVPRAGEPYAYGNLRLPVRLKKGRNDLLFLVGRGRLKVTLKPVSSPLEIDTGDPTLPDFRPDDRSSQLGAITIRNNTSRRARNLVLRVETDGAEPILSRLPEIPPETIRKVPFEIPVPPAGEGNAAVRLVLQEGKREHARAEVTVRRRPVGSVYRRTFLSGIDGSLQYFAVNPAQKPSRDNLLVMSTHGASVEAQGQAEAYSAKDDVNLVAPTNRRPYGFNWEDQGREDFLEVFAIARRTISHDPKRVHLTGHSMGGHGAWYLGSLFPDRFAVVAPAAGWISYWTYAGGWGPKDPTPAEALLRRSMNTSDVLMRKTNLLGNAVFIHHGDQDETVPVSEARTMREELTKIGHPDLHYYEHKGGGHWFGGESVDWPGIFDLMRNRKIEPSRSVDFTTPYPYVASSDGFVKVLEQNRPLLPSRVQATLSEDGQSIVATTENVRRVSFDSPTLKSLTLDGQNLLADGRSIYVREGSAWRRARAGEDGPPKAMLFKDAWKGRMAFVYGTRGTAAENQWARNKARLDAENWQVIANGAVDVLPDTEVPNDATRNLVLYGNARTNRAWAHLLKGAPVQLGRGELTAGGRTLKGSLTALFLAQNGDRLLAAVGGTDLAGMRRTDRMPVFTAGVSYPTWTLLDRDGVVGAGLDTETAWRDGKP